MSSPPSDQPAGSSEFIDLRAIPRDATQPLPADGAAAPFALRDSAWFSGEMRLPRRTLSDSSTTRWLERLKQGDEDAASELWQRYASRLAKLVRKRFSTSLEQAAYDEEDVVLSALDVFCRGMREGRHAELHGRDELWRLLAVIALRKANDRAKADKAEKRGGEEMQRQALSDSTSGIIMFLDKLPSKDQPAEVDAVLTEECERLVGLLGDPELQQVALWRLEGFNNDEIAAKLNYTRRTIQRMLKLIRQVWEREGGELS
ncbi:MAG: RNA polymerase subunit sigma-70 [Planctomycetales bacterium]|nr:RNA polymerase subunit sigma-70 [Planctomycetales bacterium]